MPFFAWLPPARRWASALLLGGALAGLAAGARARRAAFIGAALFAFVVLQDQNRFQPEFFQFALFALALTQLPPRDASFALRAFTVALYLFSGAQKLNRSFVDATGQLLLRQLAPAVAASRWRCAAALAMPLFECSLAPLLALRATRRWGVALSAVMHLSILAAVGPAGLRYDSVVWPWNVFMVVSNVLLFLSDAPPPGPFWRRAAPAAVAAAFLLRATGHLDTFPAFALFSDHIENSMILVEADAARSLPPELRPFLIEPASDGSGRTWVKLDHNRWIMAALNVPPYPQHRVQTGVALALCRRFDLGARLRVDHYASPSVWEGPRLARRLRGCAEVEADAARYRLNARPSAWPGPS